MDLEIRYQKFLLIFMSHFALNFPSSPLPQRVLDGKGLHWAALLWVSTYHPG